MSAPKNNAARRESLWTSLACIPVGLMTLIPHWIFAVQESPSISSTHDQRAAAIRDAMICAGLAVLLSLGVWRRATTVSRLVLALCVLTNLYTLFVVSGQKLHAVMGR